jgi:hypothetical protein
VIVERADLRRIRTVLQIGAAAKHLAVAGQDRNAHVAALGNLVEHCDDTIAHCTIERIHRRTVQRHDCDVVGYFERHAIVGHGFLLALA